MACKIWIRSKAPIRRKKRKTKKSKNNHPCA
jgi:hypothetical protein